VGLLVVPRHSSSRNTAGYSLIFDPTPNGLIDWTRLLLPLAAVVLATVVAVVLTGEKAPNQGANMPQRPAPPPEVPS
jgi:hypothetical protein